jgi:hypothetical protein
LWLRRRIENDDDEEEPSSEDFIRSDEGFILDTDDKQHFSFKNDPESLID